MRVQAVVSQLNGEKIDIVAWVPDEVQFIGNALSPAAVTNVLLDEETKTARVIVPDDQLSLAIGKEGQNARLAARLTGWKIDIKSETQAADEPLFQPEAYEKTAEVEEADELADSVLDPDLDLDAAPVEEIDAEPEVEIEQTEAESAETVEDEPSPDEVAALLAKIGTSAKRKSWEERFGSVSTEETAQEKSDSESEKPKQKKKKEKVIKDFSMLTLEDFQFDEED